MQAAHECYICRAVYNVRTPGGLEEHHVFPGKPGRALSEEYGLKVWLCAPHHRDPVFGVHFDPDMMLWLKRRGQQAFERTHTREEFVRLFGGNYL